ncbi:MAG: L-threonylcarbamoyladenylate synthase, partial [Clostridiales bacterium]
MKTIIRKIDQDNIDPKAIAEAAAFLQLGETVAFPTETVYGLGADALNPQAVDKIFAAKGRPGDNPLIVHVADLQGLEKVAFSNPLVEKLAKVFWPGPLTMVLPKKDIVPANVCAGLPTVGIRMPVHPVALALL